MRLLLGIFILLFAAGYSVLTGWYVDVEWLQTPWLSIIWPLFTAALCLCLIFAARFINRRDPVLIGWLAFSLCGCLLLLPLLIAKTAQERVDAEWTSQITSLHRQVQDKRRQQAQAALEQIRATRASRPKDRFTQYEGRVDAMALERIRALDAEMQAAIKAKGDAYKLALDNNPTRGPDAWITFRTRDELASQRIAHQNLYQAARGFTQFVESFEQSYTDAINAMALKPPADRIAIAEMQRILQFAEANNAYELRKLDVEVIGAALAALNVLYEDWGNWGFDRREQTLNFADPASEAAFHQALQRLKSASDAVDALRTDPKDEN